MGPNGCALREWRLLPLRDAICSSDPSAAKAWPVPLALAAVQLPVYREPEGAYETARITRGPIDRGWPPALAPLGAERVRLVLLVLKGLVETGKITPVMDRTYSFEEIPAAIRHVEEGRSTGKVVISL